ncbi:AMP-binding protein [Flavobacterium sp. GT3R68]|uniref:AMP-binding protein n=1 Tax=Flavobacterium sp. GT3R68 TaxID=2594437 RepID=UPI000F88D31A|nr:AMP-binding protein [Flavobacterium sp. GT3R68]RTY89364.1 long-chain fatty acid--CoA ligase [Flavobacterium sp. GSN2]TRW93924.1 long-chain fatty acid--CoA ligase [Flavobacterium sp. GT3R68]
MCLKVELENALTQYCNSKVIDSSLQTELTYGEIFKEIKRLERIFDDVDFKGKIIVFDFNENSINLVVLYLFMIVQEAIPVVLEVSGISSNLLKELPYFAIIKNRKSTLILESDFEFSNYETPYGAVLIKQNSFGMPTFADCALLLTSSGTAGAKKIIKCSSEGIISNIYSNIKSLNITSRDSTLLCLPIYYSYSLIGQFFSHLFQGGNIIIAPYKFVSFSLEYLLNYYKPTNFFTTPTQVNVLLAFNMKQYAFSLRFVAIGGGYLNRFSFLNFTKKYPAAVYYKTYGITEAGPRVSTYAIEHIDAPSFEPNYLGKPLENVTLSLGENAGNYMDFAINYLQISTPSIFKGYLLCGSESAQARLLETGDIVYGRENGIYILGRKSDYYTLDSTGFWSFEIEDLLFEQISGLLKIKISRNEEDIHIGIMKHPKIKLDYGEIIAPLNKRFGQSTMKNIIVENYNEQFVFTK